jgi:hypothetical protein
MNRIILFIVILSSVYFLTSCRKDGSGHKINTLEITEGEFSGFSHTFSPNMGFWSPVDETTRYVHLVLGDENNMSTGGESVMSILFYDTGISQVDFPSPEGQSIGFGINFDGIVYYFREDNAVLSITQIDDLHFDGTLTGQFVDANDSSRKINFTLYLSLQLQAI